MSKGRKRAPTADELTLWSKVVETVAPLGRRQPLTIETMDELKAIVGGKAPPPTAAAPAKPPGLKPLLKPPPALSGAMDRRTRSRLTRGAVAIDMRIDLHGLTQAAAERRLVRFLHEAQDDGARVVLVITGKGKPVGEGRGDERGVLRRMAPHWLAAPGMRSIVVGFEEAAQAHGGAGALYVRIRRRRPHD